MKSALLIMAAGMGSRYGGNKQIDRIGPNGEILVQYSLYDALEAGFNKIIFVIKKSMEGAIRELVGDDIAKRAEVCYAFQEFDTLPGGFTPPAERVKPYGTVHAVTCAKPYLTEPFAVINADDYYGKTAFRTMRDCLLALPAKGRAAMVGYRLKNTVSKNGAVTRGICQLGNAGMLKSVTETYKIISFPDGTIRDTANDGAGVVLDPEALVSMNFWGFNPWFVSYAEEYLRDFLASLPGDELKKEFPLPPLVDQMMKSNVLEVSVLSTDAVWFGVTYKEDKAFVTQQLQRLHDQGAYPQSL